MPALQRKSEKTKTPQPATAPESQPATANIVSVPSGFASLVPMGKISPPATDKVPWLVFYSDRAKDAQAMSKMLGHLSAGTAVLKVPDAESGGHTYYRVDTIQLVTARQFFTESDWSPADGYKTLSAALEQDAERKLDTDIQAVVLCHTDDGVFPAMCQFRKSHAVAAQKLAAEIVDANGQWWLVAGDLTYEARISKGKFGYVIVDAVVRPIGATEAVALQRYSEDAEMQKLSAKVAESFKAKVQTLEQLCLTQKP